MASNHNLGWASQQDSSAAAAAAVASHRAAALLAYAQACIAAQGQTNAQTLLNAAAATRNAALDPGAIVNY
jgi:hypothetical protein